MSLPSILKTAFHSYLETATDVQTCLNVSSMWKKPAEYWFTAHYCKTTNQIVWEGTVTPRNEPEYDVFMVFEGGDCITVGELFVNLAGLLHDESDLVMGEEGEEREEFFACRLVDLNNESVTVNN
jgi:hypothetical protein